MALELVESPQPYFIPGYTGHCPQYKYREGATYGSQTHKLLLDPTVQHAEYLVLSDRTANDYQVVRRPAQKDIDVVESRFQHGDPVYKHPMLPGYEGYVYFSVQIFSTLFLRIYHLFGSSSTPLHVTGIARGHSSTRYTAWIMCYCILLF